MNILLTRSEVDDLVQLGIAIEDHFHKSKMHIYSNNSSIVDEDEIINDLLEIEKVMERLNDAIRYCDEQVEESIPQPKVEVEEEDSVFDYA